VLFNIYAKIWIENLPAERSSLKTVYEFHSHCYWNLEKCKSSHKPKKGKARGHPFSLETGPRRFVCTKGWAGRFPLDGAMSNKGLPGSGYPLCARYSKQKLYL